MSPPATLATGGSRDGDVHFGRTCRPAVKQLDQVAVGDQARRRSDADVYLIRHDEHNRKLPNARREADGIGGNGLVPQLPDKISMTHTSRVGGRTAIITTIPVPELPE